MAVLVGVMFSSLFGMMGGVSQVPVRDVRVVPGLHMVARIMMLRGLAVVSGGMLMVLGCLMVMRRAGVIIH